MNVTRIDLCESMLYIRSISIYYVYINDVEKERKEKNEKREKTKLRKGKEKIERQKTV